MPDVTSTVLARGIRDPTYSPPGGPPPPFLVKPTTVARAAVRRFHQSGSAAARAYLNQALARELNHSNPSMQGNARNTVNGLGHYITADAGDGRTFQEFGATVNIALPSGTVRTKVDVVTVDRNGDLAGRAVFWDGAPISPIDAEAIAYPYAEAMRVMFPGATITDICVWQARRDTMHSVSLQVALGKAAAADTALARL